MKHNPHGITSFTPTPPGSAVMGFKFNTSRNRPVYYHPPQIQNGPVSFLNQGIKQVNDWCKTSKKNILIKKGILKGILSGAQKKW